MPKPKDERPGLRIRVEGRTRLETELIRNYLIQVIGSITEPAQFQHTETVGTWRNRSGMLQSTITFEKDAHSDSHRVAHEVEELNSPND